MKNDSEYSPAETQMILCITRERDCTPEKCLNCGWLRDDVKECLKRDQVDYLKGEEDGKTL